MFFYRREFEFLQIKRGVFWVQIAGLGQLMLLYLSIFRRSRSDALDLGTVYRWKSVSM